MHLYVVISVEEPQQKDIEEIGLSSDVDSCASSVLFEDNRPASPPVMICQNAGGIINDPGNSFLTIMHPQLIHGLDGGNRLNEEGTSALCEDIIDGFSVKCKCYVSFLFSNLFFNL